MSETDSPRDDGDDYAAAYLDEEEDESRENDDDELAAMFAKVQSFQHSERKAVAAEHSRGISTSSSSTSSHKTPIQAASAAGLAESTARRPAAERITRDGVEKPATTGSIPAEGLRRGGGSRSADGIKTISRHSFSGAPISKDALLGLRKPQIFNEKLLQTPKSADELKRLKQQAVAAPPGTRSLFSLLSLTRSSNKL